LIEKELHQSDYIGIVDESTITEDWKNLQTVAKVDIPADQYQKPLLDDILNLNDLEDVARHTLSAKSWAYIAGASNDNITRDANKSLLKKIWFRPAVMRNVESVNTRTRLFGCDLDLPIFIAPAGAAMHAGPDGELALARGAAATGIIQCIAITASYPLQEILDATPGGAFLQLYINKDKKRMEEIIRQATDSGKVKALLVTADLPAMSKREDYERVKPQVPVVTTNTDLEIPDSGSKRIGRNRQNGSFIDQTFNWNALTWLRSHTHLPIVIKGIQRSEDARIALQLGCQGIVVSNHGGRAADNAPPAILAMLELHKTCPEVFGAMEVLIDGGFRRGSDVVKAICLGASAVGFGRSFMYAVNYGQEGVEHAVNSKCHERPL
jgi:L-lactate dehydrogenase (cytochrome)